MVGLIRTLRGAFTALAAVAAATAAGVAHAQQGSFAVPDRQVWVGEVFDMSLQWRVDWNNFQNLEGPPEWKSEPLVAEPLGQPALVGPSTGAGATIGLATRAMALRPGTVTLQPARQNMVLKVGSYATDEYSRAVTASRSVQSARGTVRVRPLPPAPAGFTGAVGALTAASRVDKTELRVGDSVTWTVTVTGVGNWPMIKGLPPRSVSRDFDVIGQPKIVEEDRGEKPPPSPVPGSTPVANLFERSMSEEVVLAPTRAGRYVLSGFEMAVFDPKAGRYTTIQAAPITLQIAPGPNGEGTEPLVADSQPEADELAEEGRLPPFAEGSDRVIAPPPQWLWLTALGVLPIGLVGLWLTLAVRRAYLADPDRLARGADARLRKTLARLAVARDPAERRRLVRAWQRDVALRWKFGSVAPTPRSFGVMSGWSALWSEADRFLYARQGELPDDWVTRAQNQLGKMDSLEPFKPLTAFERGNLWPVAAALVLAVLVWQTPSADAQGPRSVRGLATHTMEAPRDWRGHYNLAIALAAQKRWEEAAAQASIAYAQAPASPLTRALWTRTAQEAGSSLEPGASVPRPRGWEGALTSFVSPAAWRWIALVLAWLAAAGAAVILLVRFGRLPRFGRHVGAGMIVAAILGGAVTAFSLSIWGPLSRDTAVLVWKAGPMRATPVDTPAEQAPHQLAAGTAGYVDGEWLGWRRLRLSNGRSGWLRQENLTWVWREPR